jgi:hypothetical protein
MKCKNAPVDCSKDATRDGYCEPCFEEMVYTMYYATLEMTGSVDAAKQVARSLLGIGS